MRSMWKGSLGFGLVNIPVSMFVATEESTISFSQLDKKDHGKIRYKKINEISGKEVEQRDIVRGYEIEGKYIIVEESDFAKAMPEKTDHLEIIQFVDEKEIDPVYYEKPYYVAPEKVGAKAYVLLRDALMVENRVGLGVMVYHNKEWFCMIKPQNKVLILYKLRFSDEVRSAAGLSIPDTPVSKEELKMASMLIGQLTKKFNPEDYRDTYSEKLMKVIEAKAAGKPSKTLKVVHNATTGDLMQKLKESLSQKRPSKRAS
jgi:DNA end-binding protein Ku